MKLLHRYIFGNVLTTCIAAVLMFAFILLTGNVVKDMLGLLSEGQLTFTAFFKLLFVLFPFVFIHALPFGLLTGVLMAMGRLSAQSELTAIRSAGVSIFRLSSSVFILAVIATVAALIVNFYYGPLAKAEYRRELANTVQKNPLSFVVEKTFVKDFDGAVLYVSNKEDSRMEDIWFWDLDDEGRVNRFSRAESARFEYNEELNTLNLILTNGYYEFIKGDDPEDYTQVHTQSFGRTSTSLSLDRILGKATFERKLKWFTFYDLVRERKKWVEASTVGTPEERAEAKGKIMDVQMAFHEKFAMGFTAISFILLGIPMGIQAQRKETSANIFLALGLALGYYFMMLAVGWLGNKPELRPDLLYWVPNIVYQAIGFKMLRNADLSVKASAA
ncbi:LptF/LptG family permease [Puniceicoccaceae bacterium K14]|nr:LptF/LptG family permease [Puniceicoccaceae bacterium K14]